MVGSKEGSSSDGAWSKRLRYGFDKSIVISDWASTYANAVSAKVGGERFWPKSNDMPLEIEKCERILRAFTVEGIPQKEDKEEQVQDGKGNWITKKRKVFRKIPPLAIKNAKAIAIYSSMRSGIAPFGGGGGAGLVLARMPDGSWSAPAAITPNNLSAGLLLGVDFLDVILLINSDEALEGFMSHKFTVGAETGLTAGPFGTGASAESGLNKANRAPVYSYVRTRGMYAGVELMGQAFLSRFDENERFYYWPGITARDVLTGKVKMPPLAYPLHRALMDAENGVAQGGKLDRVMYDIVKMPDSEVMKMLGPNPPKSAKRFVAGGSATPSAPSTPRETEGEEQDVLPDLEGKLSLQQEGDEEEGEVVKEGERLRLPPTPQELELLERAGIPDEEDLKLEREERTKVYKLPPPPMHINVQKYWRVRPEQAMKRPTQQLVMDGPHSADLREAQFTRLPPSPRSSLELREEALVRLQEKESAEEMESKEKYPDQVEGVLAKEVDEEEADRIMQAAADGGDMMAMKENDEMEELVSDSKAEKDSEADEEASEEKGDQEGEAGGHHSNDAVERDTLENGGASNEKEAPQVVTIDGEEEAEHSSEGHGEHPSSSSRPSLNLSNGHDFDSGNDSSRPSLSEENGVSKPLRPPRNRPTRRSKK